VPGRRMQCGRLPSSFVVVMQSMRAWQISIDFEMEDGFEKQLSLANKLREQEEPEPNAYE
jgi:hypothetical protein